MKNVKKIILYIHHNTESFGGGDVSLFELINNLDREKFKPIVVLTHEGLLAEMFKKIAVESKIILPPPSSKRGYPGTMKALLQLSFYSLRNKVSLVHINSLGRLHYITLVCNLLGIPCIYHARSFLAIENLHKRTKCFINSSRRVIAVSNAIKSALVDEGIREEKICVIYNGVDLERFQGDSHGAVFRRDIAVDEAAPLVGIVGRIVPWKGYEEFIRASAMVSKTMREVKFVIIGEPKEASYLGQMRSLAEEIGADKNLIFAGFRDDIVEYMSALDLLVLPSHQEPFARVVLEAMATGKPIVATNTGGSPEQVVDGVTGLLVPPKNSKALSEAILTILQDENKAKSMGINARKRAEEYFDIRRHAEKVEELYREVLKC